MKDLSLSFTVSLAFRDPHGQQSCQVGACAMIPALACCRA